MNPLQIITALLGPIAGGLGGFLGGRANSNAQQAELDRINEIIQRAQSGEAWARQQLSNFTDPAWQAAIRGITGAGQVLDRGPDLFGSFANTPEFLASIFSQNQQFGNGQTQNAIDEIFRNGGQLADRSNLPWDVFAGGGWTPGYQNIQDTLSPWMRGAGSNSNLEQQNIAAELLSGRGITNFTQSTQDRATEALNSGGRNPYLDFALQSAANTLRDQGYNPQLSGMQQFLSGIGTSLINSPTRSLSGNARGAQDFASQLLQSGGENEGSSYAQRIGLERAGREALLPYEVLRNIAGEGVSDQYVNVAKRARADSALKGGGPGFVLGYGGRDSALADFADQEARARAMAEREALTSRQGLGLQENAQGAQLYGAGAGNAATRMGMAPGLLTGIEGLLADLDRNQIARSGQGVSLLSQLPQFAQIAAGREGQAYSAIPGAQNSATNVMQVLGQLGLGAGSQEVDRLNVGRGLASDFANQIIAATNAFGNSQANQNQYALGAGSLADRFSNSGINAFNTGLSGIYGGANIANQQNQLLANMWNNANSNTSGLFNTFAGNYNTGINQLLQGGNIFGNYGQSFMPIFAAGVQPRNPNSASPFGSALGGAFGGGNGASIVSLLSRLGGGGNNSGGSGAPNPNSSSGGR